MRNIPQDDIQLARNWLERAHEASHDARALHQMRQGNASIVNRAYYSMLYAVFAILAPYSFKKGPDEDGNVIALFDDKFVQSNIISMDISLKIHDAYDLCQTYDFQPFFEISAEQAIETLSSADKFIKTIEEKLSEQS